MAFIATVLSFGVKSLVLAGYAIEGQSMMPTYSSGDHVLVDKVSGLLGGYGRGDVVVFQPPVKACGPSETVEFIKRLAGMPGDRVEVAHGTVAVNGQVISILEPTEARAGISDVVWVLGVNELFVLGDNSLDSCDSRYFGPIHLAAITGRVLFDY